MSSAYNFLCLKKRIKNKIINDGFNYDIYKTKGTLTVDDSFAWNLI